MAQPKSIGQALGHFAMAFGHMAFGQRPDEDNNEENDEVQEESRDNSPRASKGSCCLARGSKVKAAKVRGVRQGSGR